MKTEENYKLKNEWELDYSELNSKHQYELLKHVEGEKVNNELLKEALNIINIQKENYYTERETERRNKIKKGIITDEIINNQEMCSKKHLAEKFLRYGYNLEYLKSYLHLINLGYLVRVKEFIQMKDGGYLEKELSDIIIYKDIIQDFLNVIDKSIIDEYKKTNYAPEKQLYPLTMNEYVTPKKK
jgi:hypothetical protein